MSKQIKVTISDESAQKIAQDIKEGKARSVSQLVAQIVAQHYDTPAQDSTWGRYSEENENGKEDV